MQEDYPWFFPDLSRNECENILSAKKDGTFLVRCSESTARFSLSIGWANRVHHYRIKRSHHGFYIEASHGVEHCFFNTLDKLISYYKVPDRGLTHVLKEPYVREDSVSKDSDDTDEENNDTESDKITLFFKQQLDSLTNVLRSDKELKNLLEDYVEKGLNRDYLKAAGGSTKLQLLQRLLVSAGREFQSVLKTYIKRLNFIKQLFDVGSNTQMKERDSSIRQDEGEQLEDLQSTLSMLHECKNSLVDLEKKACNVFREYSATLTGALPDKKKEGNSLIEKGKIVTRQKNVNQKDNYSSKFKQIFEVTSGALKNKSFISLNVGLGKITFHKNKDDPDSGTVCISEKVHQLVKSNSSPLKLGILLENQHIKSYSFENYMARELFCQTVQHMKIAHSKDPHSPKLSIFIGTWNMGGATVKDSFTDWLKCHGQGKTKPRELSHIPADVYAIGTQESAYYEKEWTKKLKTELRTAFNKEFELLSCHSLWGIRLAIFVKEELVNLICTVKQSSVKTGIANALGNKGAVGISFSMGGTSFCFINCHLASGQEKWDRRNQDFNSILRGLSLGQRDVFDLTLSFHHVFWFGDLNYRINLEVTEIIKRIMEKDWQRLVKSEQLIETRAKDKAFGNFEEEVLTFPPTYRYERGNRQVYTWLKVKRTGNRTNVPSWCDRVLWKSYPELTSCNTTYGCPENLCTSDHSPVFATYDVDVLSQTLCTATGAGENSAKPKAVKIALFNAEAKISTSSSMKFVLEFHSNCFAESYRTKKNMLFNETEKFNSMLRKSSNFSKDEKPHSYPLWSKGEMIELYPVLSDINYLQDQHILIAVKGEDGQESYGECVVSMKSFVTGEKQEIECQLTHLGYKTGVLKCRLQMKMPQDCVFKPPLQKSKVYDLIQVEDDSSQLQKEVSQRLLIPIKGGIERSSIAQVEPSDKVVSSKAITNDNKQEPLKMAFQNPCLEYSTKNDIDIVENDLINCVKYPTMKKSGTKVNIPVPELPPKERESHSSVADASLGAEVDTDSLPREVVYSRSSSLESTASQSSHQNVPIPYPRLKKKERQTKKLRAWLQSIDCECYFDNFYSNGFEDIDYFASLTVKDLSDIGISSQHIQEILLHASKLAKSDQSIKQPTQT